MTLEKNINPYQTRRKTVGQKDFILVYENNNLSFILKSLVFYFSLNLPAN